ncbi:MAG: hypothetical protein IPK26_07545 [Planctomycetes bacterium]|nr:hypothetical protein [Planctomycetota bacterium]
MKSRTCLLAVPLLCSSLPAQQPVLFPIGLDDDYVTTRTHESITPTLSLGTVSNLVVGRCSGMQANDVLGLAGGSPLIWVWPSAHRTVCQFPDQSGAPIEHVNDLAVLVGKGDAPTSDAVALVGADGLRIWRRQAGTAAFLLDTIQDSTFHDARLVAAHRHDPSVIFCVLANGTDIGTSSASGNGYSSVQAVFPILDDQGAPTPVLAVAAIDWDNDGQADVAALTADGLVTMDRNGNELARSSYPVAAHDYPSPARTITMVRYTNLVLMQPRECIAWLAPTPTGQCVLMRGAEITNREVDIAFDHDNHLAISAGEWTGDSEDELFLTNSVDRHITMLVGAGGLVPWLFLPNLGFEIAVHTGAQDPAPAAIADLDADGDGDLFAAVGSVCSEVQSDVNPDSYSLDVEGSDRTGNPTPGMAAPILVTFQDIAPPPVPPGFGTGYEVELTILRQSLSGALEPTPVSRNYYPASARMNLSFVVDNVVLEQSRYLMLIRPVRRVQGQVIHAGKAWQQSLIRLHKDGATPVPGIVPLEELPPVPPVPPLPPG